MNAPAEVFAVGLSWRGFSLVSDPGSRSRRGVTLFPSNNLRRLLREDISTLIQSTAGDLLVAAASCPHHAADIPVSPARVSRWPPTPIWLPRFCSTLYPVTCRGFLTLRLIGRKQEQESCVLLLYRAPVDISAHCSYSKCSLWYLDQDIEGVW